MAYTRTNAGNILDRLAISSETCGLLPGDGTPAECGNLTIKTPDNVTLVLNFGGITTRRQLPKSSSLNSESTEADSPSEIPLYQSPGRRLLKATSSLSPAAESSLFDLARSPDASSSSSSCSSSGPPSPVSKGEMPFGVHTHKGRGLPTATEEPDGSASKEKLPPSKEKLKQFISKQDQIHATIAPADGYHQTAYPESWLKKRHYLSFTKHHNIRDIKFDGDCNIILTSRHSVQLYDANGHFLERLYNDKIVEPWGIFVNTGTGSVFISDHQSNCVMEFNHIGILLKKYGPVPAPCGVSVSSTGFVFVCSKGGGSVYVFDKHGKHVKKLGEGTLTAPSYIALHEKLVIVSEEARIIGFTTDNVIAFVYGYADKCKHPACLCIDSTTGYVLATEHYKDGIVAVKKDMHRALLVKDASRPVLCAISQYGHFLVGEKKQRGLAFKMYRPGKD